jgi:hypothetical protein
LIIGRLFMDSLQNSSFIQTESKDPPPIVQRSKTEENEVTSVFSSSIDPSTFFKSSSQNQVHSVENLSLEELEALAKLESNLKELIENSKESQKVEIGISTKQVGTLNLEERLANPTFTKLFFIPRVGADGKTEIVPVDQLIPEELAKHDLRGLIKLEQKGNQVEVLKHGNSPLPEDFKQHLQKLRDKGFVIVEREMTEEEFHALKAKIYEHFGIQLSVTQEEKEETHKSDQPYGKLKLKPQQQIRRRSTTSDAKDDKKPKKLIAYTAHQVSELHLLQKFTKLEKERERRKERIEQETSDEKYRIVKDAEKWYGKKKSELNHQIKKQETNKTE